MAKWGIDIREPSILDLPSTGNMARFKSGTGQRALLTVDTEEEFDWGGSFTRDQYTLDHVSYLARFQEFCEGISVSPVYLIDWPIANSEQAIAIIGEAVRKGTAEIGVQLHPWVNPPHDEDVSDFTSYAGNLPPELEREKFARLHDAICTNFDTRPLIYRAGRYGLGSETAAILKDHGIAIDTSVRAGFDYRGGHGPDYTRHPQVPYWIDQDHSLMELPLTTVFWGMLRRQGRLLQPIIDKLPHIGGIAARLGLLERISLTPEGVTVEEALRAIDIALDDGLPLLVLSFHSPSLRPGNTPYIRTESDLDKFYDWWRAVYAYLDQRNVKSTTMAEILKSVEV